MNEDPIMYSQLQPWSMVGAEPCMTQVSGDMIPPRVGNYYQTPRPHPWRPTLGYENIEVTPLPSQPITNALVDPCYTPMGMSTEPLKFPNLVTGFERNPAHAARAALYTRYTPYEWTQNQIGLFNEADTNRNFSERLRCDTVRVLRETDEKTNTGQRDSGRSLGERITDTTFWRNEASTELEHLITENNLMQEKRRELEKAIQDIESPLHIAQECLYHRENRQGIDLVHDQVEQSLLKEVEILRGNQDKIRQLLDRTIMQLRNNRAGQQELERDLKSKESALGIDNLCHQMSNFTRGINYYGGIDKYDPTVSLPETWAEHSARIIQRSQSERSKSAQLRAEGDAMINSSANDIWNQWNSTNNALARRTGEILESKGRLSMHLHKVQQEIFDVEKNLELIRKAVQDKSLPLKVAHTRLEARAHRKDVELCRDNAQARLIREVQELEDSIDKLHRKLEETEAQHQQLLKTRSNLEFDLQGKANALFIDREKCLGMRRSFPIQHTIKY